MIDNIGIILQNNLLLGIFFAILAGFISSFSPCTLTTVPLIIGYANSNNDNEENKKRKVWIYSLVFAFGIIITFTSLGVISVLIGKTFKMFGEIWNYILIAILIYVSLQMFGVSFRKKEISCKKRKLNKGILGAFFLGILGGLFSSPCCTPVLAGIVTFASIQGNILYGAIMLFFYSLGHSILIILAGTSVELVNKISMSEKYNKIGNVLRIIFGIITLIMALYLLYNIF